MTNEFKNSTKIQDDLINKFKKIDPNLVLRWDETQGIIRSIRGNLKLEIDKDHNPKSIFYEFLKEYAGLLGPPDLSSDELNLVRERKDNLGWIQLIFQHRAKIKSMYAKNGVEIYGSKLIVHFNEQGTLTKIQSSLWRDIHIDTEVKIKPEEVQEYQLKRIKDAKGFTELSKQLGQTEKLFPLTDPPRLVVYPWKGRYPLAWKTYGYGVLKEDLKGNSLKIPEITYGQLFINAMDGTLISFSPTIQSLGTEYPDTGTGLSVTPLANPQTRSLNIIRISFICINAFKLKDTTHSRNIVTYDVNCDASSNSNYDIANAILNDNLPVSRDLNKKWDLLPTNNTLQQRRGGQQPEVDAHYFAKLQYDWYDAVAGGRVGWDDNNYNDPPVPDQTINILTHCRYPTGACTPFNAYKWNRKMNGSWIYWLAFMDSDGNVYDYPSGSHFIFAHEYQHAITDFSFVDAQGNPGLLSDGWLGAVHEALSDAFAALSSEQWLPCIDVCFSTPQVVLRNIVFPRDATATNPNMLDHFDDRFIATGIYERGTIIAHCAYLIGKGGVHQRTTRNPELIPVHGIGRETVGGLSVLKAARIWYRALTNYFGTIPGNNNDTSFRIIRDGCVDAAGDLYGTGSVEHLTTILAFYAVGLHPAGITYGADVTFLGQVSSWDLSQDYIGLTCPDYVSLDLFVNNWGISEWKAIVEFENTIYCRVRNVGDVDAQNVEVKFYYGDATLWMINWLPMTDKDGNEQKLLIGTLPSGQSNFPDSDQKAPPSSASVKWYLPSLVHQDGSAAVFFAIKAEISCSNDVNPFNNLVASIIGHGSRSRFALNYLIYLIKLLINNFSILVIKLAIKKLINRIKLLIKR